MDSKEVSLRTRRTEGSQLESKTYPGTKSDVRNKALRDEL